MRSEEKVVDVDGILDEILPGWGDDDVNAILDSVQNISQVHRLALQACLPRREKDLGDLCRRFFDANARVSPGFAFGTAVGVSVFFTIIIAAITGGFKDHYPIPVAILGGAAGAVWLCCIGLSCNKYVCPKVGTPLTEAQQAQVGELETSIALIKGLLTKPVQGVAAPEAPYPRRVVIRIGEPTASTPLLNDVEDPDAPPTYKAATLGCAMND
jgi:hypothetical protein